MKITDEQKVVIVNQLKKELGPQAQLVAPIFFQVMENMTQEQLVAIFESSKDVLAAAHATNKKLLIESGKKDNAWFR